MSLQQVSYSIKREMRQSYNLIFGAFFKRRASQFSPIDDVTLHTTHKHKVSLLSLSGQGRRRGKGKAIIETLSPPTQTVSLLFRRRSRRVGGHTPNFPQTLFFFSVYFFSSIHDAGKKGEKGGKGTSHTFCFPLIHFPPPPPLLSRGHFREKRKKEKAFFLLFPPPPIFRLLCGHLQKRGRNGAAAFPEYMQKKIAIWIDF